MAKRIGRRPSHRADDGVYLWSRCYVCGHRLRFAASNCPQCRESFDGRPDPSVYPELCGCQGCVEAREGGDRGQA